MSGSNPIWLQHLSVLGPWERDHAVRVAVYSVAMGDRLGIEGDHLRVLRTAAELHDIGKLTTPPFDVDRRGHLSHPIMADLFLELSFSEQVRRWVRQHHERIDGSGYPDGLLGQQIDRESQIIGLAEYFDVAYNGSPFCEARDIGKVRQELDASPAFDPELVRTLFDVQHLIQPVGV